MNGVSLQRLLAPHEAAILAGDVRLVLCSEVTGRLDEATLTETITHLVSCYPLLAARFTTSDGQPAVTIDEDRSTTVALEHGTGLDEEFNAPLTWPEGPLLRIALVEGAGRSQVVMTLPRSFADGMSYLALHQRFWAIYTALRAGGQIPADVVEPVLGPSLDELLAAQFTARQLEEFVAERARLDATAPPTVLPPLASVNGGPGPDTSFRTITVGLDADRSTRLSGLAHEASLTTNDLVSGVLLTSLRSQLEPATGPARMLCTSAVDLRRRLRPPIPDEVLQSAATTTTLRLEVDAASTPAQVARDVHDRLRADLDSGAAAMELAAFAHMIDQHPPTLVITNVGTIAEPALSEGLEVTGVRLSPLGHLPMIFAVISRYRHCLGVNLTYSRAWFSDTQIQGLAEGASRALHDLTQ